MKFECIIYFKNCMIFKFVELPFLPTAGMLIEPFEHAGPYKVKVVQWWMADNYGTFELDASDESTNPEEREGLKEEGWENDYRPKEADASST